MKEGEGGKEGESGRGQEGEWRKIEKMRRTFGCKEKDTRSMAVLKGAEIPVKKKS